MTEVLYTRLKSGIQSVKEAKLRNPILLLREHTPMYGYNT